MKAPVHQRGSAVLLLVPLLACSGGPGQDAVAPPSDTEADSDTDVDVDADPDTGWDEGELTVLRGQDALAGGVGVGVKGFGGSECGDWIMPGEPGEVLVHCGDPWSGSSTGGLLHRVDGAALLSGTPTVLATLSGVYVGHGQANGGMSDLDGDALGELGVRNATDGGLNLGYVVPGSAWAGDTALEDVAWRLVGDSGYVGLAPQVVADADGDGTADLLVVQETDSYVDDSSVGSRLILIPGASLVGTQSSATVLVLRIGSYVIEGTRGLGAPGVIGGVGDVDGDGLEDLGVAFGPWSEPGLDQSGDVRIVLSTTLGAVTLDDCPSVTGVLSGRLLESALVRLGDLDGDGRSELAVGFVKDDDTGSDSRRLEFGVVNGASIAPATTTVIAPWEADLQDYSGVGCDLDGDGLPEWVSADGIWSGGSLSTTAVAIGPGVDAIGCLGDLDGDGVQELGL